MRRPWPAIVAAAGITLAAVVPAVPAVAAARAAAPMVRVNQVGYPTAGPKVAYVMLARPARSVRFEVTTPYGVAYRGTSAADAGPWNSAFVVGTGAQLYRQLVDNAVQYFTSERDGPDVVPSVPADDYTAASLLAFALGGDQGSSLG